MRKFYKIKCQFEITRLTEYHIYIEHVQSTSKSQLAAWHAAASNLWIWSYMVIGTTVLYRTLSMMTFNFGTLNSNFTTSVENHHHWSWWTTLQLKEYSHSRYLECCILTSSLNCNEYITAVCTKASKQLYFLKLLKHSGMIICYIIIRPLSVQWQSMHVLFGIHVSQQNSKIITVQIAE